MHTQPKANWLPISLIALAAAIVFAGTLIANSLQSVHAGQQQLVQAQTSAEIARQQSEQQAGYQRVLDAQSAAQQQALDQQRLQSLQRQADSDALTRQLLSGR